MTNIPHLLSSVAAGVALLPDPNQVVSAALSLAGGAPLAGMASAEAAEDAVAASATLAARHFTYEQATGRMFLTEAGENDLMATGYSGSSAHGGKNNPQAQCEADIGPIPRGVYKIGKPRKGPTPFSLPLTPDPSNAMCGRSAFLIHGDSIAAPGTASHGCIILARPDRERIAESGVKQLVVVAEL
ncbi:MAG: tlde1 domain-containing protein [Microvirga sp.]